MLCPVCIKLVHYSIIMSLACTAIKSCSSLSWPHDQLQVFFPAFCPMYFCPLSNMYKKDTGVRFGRKLEANIFLRGCEQRAKNSVFWKSVKVNWLESRTNKQKTSAYRNGIEHLTDKLSNTWMEHKKKNRLAFQSGIGGIKRFSLSAWVYIRTNTQYKSMLYFLNKNTSQ